MDYLLSQSTRDRLMRLLAEQPGRAPFGGRVRAPRFAVVLCLSETAVGGNDVLDQCYPAVILGPSADAPAPPAALAPVLLTLLGADGAAVAPAADTPYVALLTGEVESDGSGSGSGAVTGRLRAFAVTGAGDEVFYAGSTVVRVLNDTGGTIPIRSVVRTYTPVDEAGTENATTDPEVQQARPLFLVTSLDQQDDFHGWVVTIEAIAAGKIGLAVIQGVAVVDVYVPPEGSGGAGGARAQPFFGASAFLIASQGGSAKVLWPNPFPGSGQIYRSVVLLEGRVPAGRYYEYRTDCEVVEGFTDPVNVRYRRFIDLENGVIGSWEFDSYQGCCGCSAGSGGSAGGPDPGGTDTGTYAPAGGTLPKSVTDGDCVTVPITVSGLDAGATLSGVALALAHPNVGGIRITLTNPGGRRATLVDKPTWGTGDSPADGLDVQLKDGAPLPIGGQTRASGTITGVFAPTDPLSGLADGSDPNGTYLLEICSTGSGGPGSLTALSLCFGTDTTAAAFTVAASVNDNDIAVGGTVAVNATFTGGTPDYVTIDWGDGGHNAGAPGDLPASHTYTTAGVYTVTVTGVTGPCGASASGSAVVVVGGTGGTVGGCAAGAALVLVPSTTCLSGALNANRYVLVNDGTGHWLYDAGGPVAGGGIQTIDLYDNAGAAEALVTGNCADGSEWGVTLTQGSIACSPLDITLAGTTAGGATCACSTVGFNAEVTEL